MAMEKLLFDCMTVVLADLLGVDKDEIKPEASFANDFGIDSLGMLLLIQELEESLEIKIPDEEAIKIKTVGGLVEAVVLAKQCTKARTAYEFMLSHLVASAQG